MLEKYLQGFPSTAAEVGKKFSIIEKVSAHDLRDAEDEMPVRNLLEDVHTEPFAELHNALLVTGRTEMTPFAGECEEIFMAAVFA